MTNEEVIRRIRYKAENIKAKLEPSYFGECADYLERYRWHDLRKNPEDLPIKDGFYNILILTNGKAVYASANWSNLIRGWIYDSQYELKRHTVIAWKEIEPFEEEEE